MLQWWLKFRWLYFLGQFGGLVGAQKRPPCNFALEEDVRLEFPGETVIYGVVAKLALNYIKFFGFYFVQTLGTNIVGAVGHFHGTPVGVKGF